MAAKPLHVRRLQKALHEWLNNPGMFQQPLFGQQPCSATNTTPDRIGSPSPSQGCDLALSTGSRSPSRDEVIASPSPGPSRSRSTSPAQPCLVLGPMQITRLATAAQKLVHNLNLTHLDQKASIAKRRACKELKAVITMADDDPQRLVQIRRYAAIYGRFDCKRKPEKPLTLHEVFVNEAAAQICYLAPSLLTRRDELFPLARQVVRDSGYHYSKGYSKSISAQASSKAEDSRIKRVRLESPGLLSELTNNVFSQQARVDETNVDDYYDGNSESEGLKDKKCCDKPYQEDLHDTYGSPPSIYDFDVTDNFYRERSFLDHEDQENCSNSSTPMEPHFL